MSKPSVVLEQRVVPEPSVLLEPEDIPIPDTDDLVIDILTGQMIDFDERSTDALELSAVTCGDKKRVEVDERKMTDGEQSWPDYKVFVVVNKSVAGKGRVMRARWVLTRKSTGKAKARLCVLEPRLDRSSWRQRHTFCADQNPDPVVRGLLPSGSWCQETSRQYSCQETRSTATFSWYTSMIFETF